ncbi:MAG TPA: hypothetical protein VFT78_01080 [Hanamia sp.]|nr:hypothetical protein [Hanamia sp.]
MAKRVIWTNTAREARRNILEYWIIHNGSTNYSRKLSKLFKKKVSLIYSLNIIKANQQTLRMSE